MLPLWPTSTLKPHLEALAASVGAHGDLLPLALLHDWPNQAVLPLDGLTQHANIDRDTSTLHVSLHTPRASITRKRWRVRASRERSRLLLQSQKSSSPSLPQKVSSPHASESTFSSCLRKHRLCPTWVLSASDRGTLDDGRRSTYTLQRGYHTTD